MDRAETTYLIELRHQLHQAPERSGLEEQTARRIQKELEKTRPDHIVNEIGGHGLFAVYESGRPGPTLLFRSELDALPIPEEGTAPYQSRNEGFSHACGHDGHMTVLIGLARKLGRNRPPAGKILILFQPAEETGEGALKMASDPVLKSFNIDRFYAWHNLPGYEAGTVYLREGVFSAASVGLQCILKGVSSHAAYPEQGKSPSPAVSRLSGYVTSLSRPDRSRLDFSLATVTYIRMGEPAFGITPGLAEVGITLRAARDSRLEAMKEDICQVLRESAEAYGLNHFVQEMEPFPAVVNAEKPLAMVREAATGLGMDIRELEEPFPWSEDMGYFRQLSDITLFGVGAGQNCPHLHSPEYDFPDSLIEPVTKLLITIADKECK
ncbi:MAG: amidohydrolase [Balneolaceae bacterium]